MQTKYVQNGQNFQPLINTVVKVQTSFSHHSNAYKNYCILQEDNLQSDATFAKPRNRLQVLGNLNIWVIADML